MTFIKLTLRDNSPVWLNSAHLTCLIPGESSTRVFERGAGEDGYWTVTESPTAILAAIAEAEGAPADDETPLDEVRAHLGAALSQVGPSDDQIIVDHIRAAYALLRSVRQP